MLHSWYHFQPCRNPSVRKPLEEMVSWDRFAS